MLSLALDFSSPVRSVAVLDTSLGHPPSLLGETSDNGNRAIKPLTLVEAVLAKAGVERKSVDAILVGLGPGSYTGIRSKIALAQGWQLGRPVRLAGVSSVECLTLQAQTRGWYGEVDIVIDGQRQEVYLARYHIRAERRELIQPLRLVKAEELQDPSRPRDAILVGPESIRWSANGRIAYPTGHDVGRLAQIAEKSAPEDPLIPIYLRETAFVKAKLGS